jgi:peptide/nickel transport system substrate-binding protein
VAEIGKRSLLARAGVAAVAVSSAGLGLGLTSAGASAHAAKPQQSSSTITWALPAAGGPTYIFPMVNGSFFTVPNMNYFQFLMYRPMYWYGSGSQVKLNAALSLASPPVYSNGNKTVTFTLKGWKWSNGETVDAKDVEFWINMQKSVDGLGAYGGYVPGTFPDDVRSISISGNTVTMQLTGGVNPTWFTYDALSEIVPMPIAWDITSMGGKPGSGGCSAPSFSAITVDSKGKPSSTAAKDCEAVYDFLSTQSGFNPVNSATVGSASSSWPSSPIWSVVDGPWKLSSYNSTGNIVFVPNKSYGGSPKPSVSEFIEQNYTSNTAEFSSLLSGNVDVGYIPAADIRTPAPNAYSAGPNFPTIASTFTLAPWPAWEISYWWVNENSNGVAGNELRQAYIRQAMQSMINEPLLLQKVYKGYGVPTYGPVPVYPKTSYVTSAEANNPWPYNPSTARKLLTEHGWTIKPGGRDVCNASRGCGAGIPKGSTLTFLLQYESGNVDYTERVTDEVESWSTIGIQVSTKPEAFAPLIAASTACAKGTSACKWQISGFGGWLYIPDYYPTGEDLFEPGSVSNFGSYSNDIATSLIKATDFQTGSSFFAKYENFIAQQVPVLWQPLPDQFIEEIKDTVKGVTPLNPLLLLTPEAWRVSS